MWWKSDIAKAMLVASMMMSVLIVLLIIADHNKNLEQRARAHITDNPKQMAREIVGYMRSESPLVDHVAERESFVGRVARAAKWSYFVSDNGSEVLATASVSFKLESPSWATPIHVSAELPILFTKSAGQDMRFRALPDRGYLT